MKIIVYLLLLFLSVFYQISAQNVITPVSNKYTMYIDNIIIGNETGMDFSKVPAVLFENYYRKFFDFSTNQYFSTMDFFFEKDTIHNENSLHIRTKKAKDGYLFVNKNLTNKLKECCNSFNEISISYVYNGKTISTKDEVMQILKLREKNIQILSIIQDEKTNSVIINFANKGNVP